jgi:hypothetical protein
MHETYRMLGREHEADLEREALKRRRAADAAAGRRAVRRPAKRLQVVLSRAAALLGSRSL